MTPLRFEEVYQADWAELEQLIAAASSRRRAGLTPGTGARFAPLYRRACGHLALARARAYPAYLTDRLEQMTAEAHQLIYLRREFGITRFIGVFAVEFPRAVRQHWRYVAAAALVFLIPAVVVGLIVYSTPERILSVVSQDEAAEFERMYSAGASSLGRTREASTDWVMFGYYIRNNVGVAFQCFSGGLLVGLGSLVFLALNGAFTGAVAGYLSAHGLGSTFFSFVVTHSAFELTAIALAGAAGLRLGHALLAPGRLTRGDALVRATGESIVLLYGVMAMLVVAAAVEAFWSSANWLLPAVKYGVAALCWAAVGSYLLFQGRHAG